MTDETEPGSSEQVETIGQIRHRMFPALAVMTMLVIAAGCVLIGHFAWTTSTASTVSPTTTTTPTTIATGPPAYGLSPGISVPSGGQGSAATGAPANAASLAKGADSALVDIDTNLAYEGEGGAGTGIVLSSSGEVLTNNHVIEGETSISVRDVGNGKTYSATVVGYDRALDIAVVQLRGASGLDTAALGNSTSVKSGDGVVAVGNAEGLGGTPSYAAGSVTATNQSITAMDDVNGSSEQLSGLIETNAAIVAGDSGGAVVNSAGKVIGMVTAGSTSFRFQTSATEGFAIPINLATSIAAEIVAHHSSGTVHVGATAFLGVDIESPISGTGAEIVEIFPGTPAASAGLVAGDIITSLDGKAVASPDALTGLLLAETPGSSVQLQYLNPLGVQSTTTVTLGSGPPQ